MPQARRKRRAIARVPRQDLLETMNALITPRLFFGLETSEPAALVPSSSTLQNDFQKNRRFPIEFDNKKGETKCFQLCQIAHLQNARSILKPVVINEFKRECRFK